MKPETDSPAFRAWESGPGRPPYPATGQVHVWRVCLSSFRLSAALWRRILSPEENDRADRFHFDRDRETWLITRGILRTLLGCYLDLPASNLELTANASGKPALHSRFLSRDFRFNVSHSGQCSLLAFASGIDIGVDVECHQARCHVEELATSVLSPDDLAVFQRLPLHLRPAAFFAAWTRKEAVLKACGVGLSLSPELIEVTFAPNEDPALRRGPDLLAPFDRWSLRSLDVAEHYSAAVAAPAAEINLSLWNFPEFEAC